MLNKDDKLRRIQKLLSEGMDLSEGSIAPFLTDDRPQVIDRVQDGLATLESGEVIPIRNIENPERVPLEGAIFRDGRAYSGTERREAAREKLDKIRGRDSIPSRMGVEGARYLRDAESWRKPDYTEDEFFKQWPVEAVAGFLFDRKDEADDRPAWVKKIPDINVKLNEIRKMDEDEGKRELRRFIEPHLPKKQPWE